MKYSTNLLQNSDDNLFKLMNLIGQEGIISFAGGFPDASLFPVEEMKKITSELYTEYGTEVLQYSSVSGYTPLREKLAKHMGNRGNREVLIEEILITSGSQQALDMSGMVFLNAGDIVLVEKPSYIGAINAFSAYGAKFIEIPCDEDGIIVSELEKALIKYNDAVKMIYVIPDFKNPTSSSWSVERRIQFMEIAEEYDIPILEDTAYCDLQLEKIEYPSLYSLSTKGTVIYLGTFSKTLCPGLRVGWIAGREDILHYYRVLKSSVDLSSPALSQYIVNRYLEQYSLSEHIKQSTDVYRQKRDLCHELMKAHFPAEVSWNLPKGGLFFWVTLPQSCDTEKLLEKSVSCGVAFVPGNSFYPVSHEHNHFRLNFSFSTIEDIKKGIPILGEVLTEFVRESYLLIGAFSNAYLNRH